MRATTFAGLAGCLLLSALGTVAPGCGGGGGGGGPDACDPASGTVVPIALQGDTAPGTISGTFGTFPADAIADVAEGGWTVFVADIVGDVTASRGVFVVTPSGVVVDVFQDDENAPPPAGLGTDLDDFLRVWITKTGRVVVLAETPSSGRAFVTAKVSAAGVVSEETTAFETGQTLPTGLGPSPLATGTLTTVDEDSVAVDDDGDIFFVGTGSTTVNGIWTVKTDGTFPAAVAVKGDGLPAGATGKFGSDFAGLGINAVGTLVAYAASIILGPATDGLFGNTVDPTSNAPVERTTIAVEGDTAPGPGGRTFDDAYDGGPIVVSSVSGNKTFVSWRADLSGSTPDKGVFWRRVGPTMGSTILVGGPSLSTSGIGISPGIYGDLSLMDSENDPGVVCLLAPITGNSVVQNVMLRVIVSDTPGTERVLYDGEAVPGGGAAWTDVYPSIVEDRVPEVSTDDGIAFTAQIDDFSTAVWLALRGCSDPFRIAEQGDLVPDDPDLGPGLPGGTYASFLTPSFITSAPGVVLFRAAIVAGTRDSGLFRRM